MPMCNRFAVSTPLFSLFLIALIPTRTSFDDVPGGPRLAAQAPVLAAIDAPEPGTVSAQAFTLDAPRALRIEAAGADRESTKRIARGRYVFGRLLQSFIHSDRDVDDETWPANAWILNASTREVVWELRRTRQARTRDGLLTFTGDIRLPAGTYEAYYAFFPLDWHHIPDGWRWLSRSDEEVWRDVGLRISGAGQALGDVRRLAAQSDASTIVSFVRLGDNASQSIGFALDKSTELHVRAIGEAGGSTTYDYGWIINADTRERVWEFTHDRSEPAGGADKNRLSRARITLPAGRYAAFFVTDANHSAAGWNAPPPFDPSRYGLTIRVTNPGTRASVKTFAYEPVPRAQAIVALTGVGDGEYHSRGFTLEQPFAMRIFALGEGDDETLYDRAWITRTTGETVWDMAKQATEHAGGAAKNRLFDGVVRFEPGSYMVHYATDDSHSAEGWNDAPPADRDYWGITVLPAEGKFDRTIVSDYDPARDPTVFARIVGVRDGQVTRRRFALERDGAVRIYALGEGSDGEMFDYAWIADLATGRRVWQMQYEDTEHAGGADKNRVFEGSIRLSKGEYEVAYRSDDSHAFGAWNSTPPRDFSNWGVTLRR